MVASVICCGLLRCPSSSLEARQRQGWGVNSKGKTNPGTSWEKEIKISSGPNPKPLTQVHKGLERRIFCSPRALPESSEYEICQKRDSKQQTSLFRSERTRLVSIFGQQSPMQRKYQTGFLACTTRGRVL